MKEMMERMLKRPFDLILKDQRFFITSSQSHPSFKSLSVDLF